MQSNDDRQNLADSHPELIPMRPLVSIGLPVYNGEEQLERALNSLLSQDYPAIEITISDNASTDSTPEIGRRFAREHRNITYIRNEENIGAVANFLSVLQHARGRYFLWAGHDDTWSPNYISSLVELLEAHPEAVLATAPVIYVHPDGSPTHHSVDRAAPGTSTFQNLRIFVDDDACGWIYGLFRPDWLRQYVGEWGRFDGWRSDLIWLFDVILRFPVVGTQQTTLYKSVIDGRYRQTQRDRLVGWLRICRELTRSSLQRKRGWERIAALRCAWSYCHRKYLRRGNPIGTTVRILKVLAMAAYFGLEALLSRRARLSSGTSGGNS